MNQPILSLIKTKDHQAKAINLLETLIQSAFKARANQSFESNYEKVIYEELIKTLSALKSDNPTDRERFLTSLLSEVKEIPVLKLTLAFEPTEQSISNIIDWAQVNLNKKVVLDIDIDPKILGGAIVVSDKGNYNDLTLVKKLDEFFASNREEILN